MLQEGVWERQVQRKPSAPEAQEEEGQQTPGAGLCAEGWWSFHMETCWMWALG